jgi:hypothetical protein
MDPVPKESPSEAQPKKGPDPMMPLPSKPYSNTCADESLLVEELEPLGSAIDVEL